VRSNAVDVIVIDSVAALVPRAELDGDMGDSLPGLQARLMSQALRKLTAAISRSGCCVIFINQIREKIGVMFGCLSYDTRVILADGRPERIGRIVRRRLPVEVLSYDPATGRIEPRRVVNWFDNGVTDSFIQYEVRGGPAHRRNFAVTPNHLVFTPRGEVPAGELRVGDEVLFCMPDYKLTEDQWQVLVGGSLGDGSLRLVGKHSAHFRVAHAHGRRITWFGNIACFSRSLARSVPLATASVSARSRCLLSCRSGARCMKQVAVLGRQARSFSSPWTHGPSPYGMPMMDRSWVPTHGGARGRRFCTTSHCKGKRGRS